MPATSTSETKARACVLVFNESHLLAVVRDIDGRLVPAAPIAGTPEPTHIVDLEHAGARLAVHFVLLQSSTEESRVGATWASIRELERLAVREPDQVSPLLAALVPAIRPHLIRIPYLNFSENEYVFRFRTDDQRNIAVYTSDDRSRALYQSELCAAIKAARRQKERTADAPAVLDFGVVRYVLPSHFGFCLGVQNAIERAYEAIAENPGRRVFMISELIHNPFVNDDLRSRGLTYLQTDRGAHIKNPETGRDWWDELVQGDVVLTPAFGATDEDKVRLIERGISVNRYDATCMLVEKVWKAARRYAQAGYTVVIHGKSEHEETKATFSNSAKYGPSIIIRDTREAEALGAVILAEGRAEKERLFAAFAGKHSLGFDVERDLQRLAVVNQTTLLRNETVGIIDLLESIMVRRYGPAEAGTHIHNKSRGDTLCYATQVNQDALQRALEIEADAAIVIGGRNSSNTYQLFRLCEARYGAAAHYIQSERNILSLGEIEHYHYPYKPGAPGAGETRARPFLAAKATPQTILITGGASCPDGIIQQVIARVNGFHPPESLRPLAQVIAEIDAST
ncbi:MAG: 4-hydroxy-3-methylbut-2-enyl diphosphate reductase [Opitutaceae bacterium]|nr:4-hydroxy-3-methylbut-2-enyl diphosphate reductase [Opitutaceae bacterium]